MLKTILSVSGKPGLYKLVSNGKNMIIVESLVDKKKLPIYARDKVVSLGDISIYTETDEVPLREVFISIKKKENGATSSIATGAKPEELKKYLEEVLPAFDKERVYPTDIKKMLNWYNILIAAEVDFETEEKVEDAETSENTKDVETGEKAETKKSEKGGKESKAKITAKTDKPKMPKNTSAKATTSSKAAKTATPRKAK